MTRRKVILTTIVGIATAILASFKLLKIKDERVHKLDPFKNNPIYIGHPGWDAHVAVSIKCISDTDPKKILENNLDKLIDAAKHAVLDLQEEILTVFHNKNVFSSHIGLLHDRYQAQFLIKVKQSGLDPDKKLIFLTEIRKVKKQEDAA